MKADGLLASSSSTRDRGGSLSPLSYLEAGSGDRAVVLVHGNFAGKSWWREILADPPIGSRLISPDLPGFGDSPGACGFVPSMTGYASSLARFLDDVGVERPILVGHSFGAAVATELALAASNSIPAMLFLSPAPLNGLATPDFIYPFLAGYRRDRQGLRRALRRTMRTHTPPYLDDLVNEAAKMHPASFTANARIVADWNVTARLAATRTPSSSLPATATP